MSDGKQPDGAVLAAIAAAVDAVWPRPAVPDDGRALRHADAHPAPSWRFSGRSWGGAVASNRSRPAF